ncbi:MAG: hypothetical protein AVO34_07580 [Firmicutes bacterium ML8_F2]|nr:MAG: hypothetical protein AVO34_07580 [Firmicutes bacterium ML8_F2]
MGSVISDIKRHVFTGFLPENKIATGKPGPGDENHISNRKQVAPLNLPESQIIIHQKLLLIIAFAANRFRPVCGILYFCSNEERSARIEP